MLQKHQKDIITVVVVLSYYTTTVTTHGEEVLSCLGRNPITQNLRGHPEGY